MEKILTRRGPVAEMPPLPPETPSESMPPLPPPTPTEAASLQPVKKKAPYKCTKCGQNKKSDCACPKKPSVKKKSKLPETDEPLEAIESRFLSATLPAQ